MRFASSRSRAGWGSGTRLRSCKHRRWRKPSLASRNWRRSTRTSRERAVPHLIRPLAVAALRLRSREFKELEIVVLRHELAVLRRQVARPRLEESDRVFLAAASRLLGRASRLSFFVRPETLLGWHQQLVRRRWTYAGRRPGRPAVS